MRGFAKVGRRISAMLLVLVMLCSLVAGCVLQTAAQDAQQGSSDVSDGNGMKAEQNDYMMVMAVVMVIFSVLVLAVFGALGFWISKVL